MTNKLLSIIPLIASCVAAHADGSMPGNAVITGHTTALPDSTEMLLYKWNGDVGTLIGKDTVLNGKYRFEIPDLTDVVKTDVSTLAPGLPTMERILYIGPGAEVEIEGDDALIYTWPVRSNVAEQAEFDRFLYHNKHLWDQYQQYGIEIQKKSGSSKRFSEMQDSIRHIINERELSYLKTAPVTDLWLDLFTKFGRFIKNYSDEEADDLRAVFESLDDSMKTSAKGQKLRVYLYPETELAIGDKIPDLPLFDLDGNEHHFRDYSGKWILVDIWSSGCGPCIMAMPELDELRQKKTDAYEIISLSIDNEDSWRSATQVFNVSGLNFNEGVEDRGIYGRLPQHALPSYLIISPDGIIQDMWNGHSKGIYGRKIRYYTRDKEEPRYSESDGMRIITNPAYDSNTTACILDIEKIEMSDKGTTIYFNMDFIPKNWIIISPNSYLSTSDGTRFAIIGSEGMTPGEHLYGDEEGKGSFSITFEPLPLSVTDFDFIEDDDAGNWKIRGIKTR